MYPINICMKGCQAAIFGGGAVALRKLGRLLEEGAKVVLEYAAFGFWKDHAEW